MDKEREGNCTYFEELSPIMVWKIYNDMRLQGSLCDAVLEAENRQFRVHRAVLAANSSYFRYLFTEKLSPLDPSITVKLTDITPTNLEQILEYLYTRDLKVTPDNFTALMRFANTYDITGLAGKCTDFLASALTPDNAISRWKFANRDNHWDFSDKVARYILTNFYEVARKSIEFQFLEIEELNSFLMKDDLNVSSEEVAFDCIIRWIQTEESTRLQYLPVLLRSLRLGLVSPEYFVSKIIHHPYVGAVSACAPLIQAGFNLLDDLQTNGNACVNLSHPLLKPRIPNAVIFAIGGWSGGSPVKTIETYDTRSDRWFSHSDIEESNPRAYHGMVVYHNCIYIIGGYDGENYYRSVKKFDPVKKFWSESPSMLKERCYIVAVTHNEHIYVCGGFDGQRRLGSVERFHKDTQQWKLVASMLNTRSDCGAVSFKGYIYVAGGFDGTQCLSSVEVYDDNTDQWTYSSPMVYPRSGISLATNRNYIYAVGGFDGVIRLRSAERFDRETNCWQIRASMFTGRSNSGCVVLENLLFIIGGFNGQYTVHHVECFNDERNEWLDATDMNINRSALKACVIADLPNVLDYTYYGNKEQETLRRLGISLV